MLKGLQRKAALCNPFRTGQGLFKSVKSLKGDLKSVPSLKEDLGGGSVRNYGPKHIPKPLKVGLAMFQELNTVDIVYKK